MKILTRTARWFVAPSRTGICLTAGGTDYLMSASEADALAESLDQAALYARNLDTREEEHDRQL